MNPGKIKVLIADDHPLLLGGLKVALEKIESISTIFVANDGKEADEIIKSETPDIAILDIDMPFYTGLEVARRAVKNGTRTKIVFLTLHKEKSLFDEAKKLDIAGYSLKGNSLDEIEICIQTIINGRKYFSPELNMQMNESKIDLSTLTKTEFNILRLIAQNKTSPEIADILFVSKKTIENHRANIVKKLKLKSEKNSLLKWVLNNQEDLKLLL